MITASVMKRLIEIRFILEVNFDDESLLFGGKIVQNLVLSNISKNIMIAL